MARPESGLSATQATTILTLAVSGCASVSPAQGRRLRAHIGLWLNDLAQQAIARLALGISPWPACSQW